MKPRAIRRAAEHKAAKLAAKAARQNAATEPQAQSDLEAETSPLLNDFINEEEYVTAEKSFSATASGESVESAPTPSLGPHKRQSKPPISDARLAANRKNAEYSTGARTIAGKLKVSLNALKTGLTSQVVVMPHEDAAVYQDYLTATSKNSPPLPTTNKSWRKAS